MTTRDVRHDGHELAPTVVCLAKVKEREVRWLWKGWLPLGKLTILDGDPGDGKSTILADIAARKTKGRAMPDDPDDTVYEPRTVIFLAAEDDVEDTLKPRFRVAGADLEAVRVVSNAAISFPSGVDVLAKLVRDLHAVMVVIDPIEAHLDERVDPNSNPQVRKALQPLVALAAKTGAAVVLVRHLRKTGGKALYAGAGSIGFAGLAREVLLVGRDAATGARTLACSKASVSEKPISLSVELRPRGSVAIVEWLGPVATVADDLTDEPGEMSALEEACQFLRVELASEWVWARQVQQQAVDANIAPATMRRARAKLGVRSVRGSKLPAGELFGRDADRWYMALPEPVPDVKKGVKDAEQFLASGDRKLVPPTDEQHERHDQVPLCEGQTPSSGPTSVVAQSTCSSPVPMTNNPGGTCSTDDGMSNNLSNNEFPGESTDLEVVVHVAQELVSQCGGCGQSLSDDSDEDDFAEGPAALFGLCTECRRV